MNEMRIFTNEEFGEIRVIEQDGAPWFVGKDVAEKLGYSNTKDAIISHVDDEDKRIVQRSEIATLENNIPKSALPVNFVSADIPNRGLMFINESGLYSLVLSSKLESAKRFKHWVTSEVLPSIRNHGAYMTDQTLEQALTSPDFLIRLATELKESKEQNRKLQVENSTLTVDKQIMQPKAEYFDELVDRNLLTNFTEGSKQIGVKRNAFISFMVGRGYLYRDKKGNLLPYANKKTEGLFEVKQATNQKTGWAGCQTLLTPKGIETFRLLCRGI